MPARMLMKTPRAVCFFAFLSVGIFNGLAQSTPAAASQHASNAASHAAQASGELVAASAAAAGSGLRLVSGIAAVPLWLSGNIAIASGELTTEVAEGLWDLSMNNSKPRPELHREIGLPAAPAPRPEKTKDLSPAEALKRTL